MVVKLNRSQIDPALWDALVEESFIFNPNAYSWLLDEVSPGWAAWVELDEAKGRYRAALPVPYMRKWGMQYVRQSPFCFQLGVLAPEEEYPVHKLLNPFLSSERFISEYYFNKELGTTNFGAGVAVGIRSNYILEIGSSAAEGIYNQNRRRALKTFHESGIRLLDDVAPEILLDLFYRYTADKIYGIRNDQYEKMQRLALLYRQKLQFYSLAITSEEAPIGAAWFLGGQRRAYYLMAAYAPMAYKRGGATGLIDAFIKQRGSCYDTLSFNGSEEAGVARFYKSFGAREVPYTSLRQVKLPHALQSFMSIRSAVIKRLNQG